MKFKSYKNWATVLCAAAVFSFVTLCDAQAGLPKPGIMPPPPIGGTTDGKDSFRPILPAQPVDENLTTGEELNGDFSGRLIVD